MPSSSTLLPDFIVIGAEKAGSTLVNACLRDHPDIYTPRNEVTFFEHPEYQQYGLDFFDKLFRNAKNAGVRGFKRPTYLGLPEIPPRIATHLPDVKLIAVLRDPVDRALSAYYHTMASGKMYITPVENGLQAILDKKPDDRTKPEANILEYGFYHKHLSRYLEHFQDQQLTVILLDDIKQKGAEPIQQLYRILGVSDDFAPPSLSSRPMAGKYSYPRLRIRQTVQPLFMYHNTSLNRSFRRKNPLSKGTRLAFQAVDRLFLKHLFPSHKPQLPASLEQQLAELYHQDVLQLEKLLNRSLQHWRPLHQTADPSSDAPA